uniref:Secreted protein n=1 Tax=Setaria viridis TaxID=4556 RepID=A0A4U6TZ56_SETVI|nr:hypothetical protein SEVIR_6G027850v2 [Setaria viridis]
MRPLSLPSLFSFLFVFAEEAIAGGRSSAGGEEAAAPATTAVTRGRMESRRLPETSAHRSVYRCRSGSWEKPAVGAGARRSHRR